MSDYIPSELIPDILARLAVKDVLRCTSVCKSWYSLITSPYFTFSHIKLSSPNQEPRLLIKYWKNRHSLAGYYMHRDCKTFDEIEDLVDLPSRFRDEEFEVIDCLNGLVCLHDCYENIIVLWNPALRKYIVLPKPRVLPCSEISVQTVGFGFVPASNEYKIVSFIITPLIDCQAEIYEQSTGSWRDLNLVYYSDVKLLPQQAHFNGILHWFSRGPNKVNPTVSNLIYSFDLKNEKLGTLMVPSCRRHVENTFFVPSTFRESLYLIEETENKFCEIWIMKEYGVADSWEKLFIIDRDKHHVTDFCCFRHNWEMLFVTSYRDRGTRMVSYNQKNNQVKRVGIRSSTCIMMFAYTYVESLLLINVPNVSRLMNNPKNISKNV